ncbi:MAG: transcription elongation factor GreA, partial [Rhodocyclaceae bacterium]|nr:transcription elongation factor GreA [Rhodocyclaceae bacterium]
MSKVPITLKGAELLREELHRLKTVERPAVIAAIAEARSHGDLSENAEYDAAKERQGFIEGRIAEIEGKLAHAQIIDPKSLDADGRVVFGATVELEDTDEGQVVSRQRAEALPRSRDPKPPRYAHAEVPPVRRHEPAPRELFAHGPELLRDLGTEEPVSYTH